MSEQLNKTFKILLHPSQNAFLTAAPATKAKEKSPEKIKIVAIIATRIRGKNNIRTPNSIRETPITDNSPDQSVKELPLLLNKKTCLNICLFS
jgi:hypothetical protein